MIASIERDPSSSVWLLDQVRHIDKRDVYDLMRDVAILGEVIDLKEEDVLNEERRSLALARELQSYESSFDSVAHELIELIKAREKELTGLNNEDDHSLIDAYYHLRNELHKKIKEVYPDYGFENF